MAIKSPDLLQEPAFVSRQVSEARRYYLNLAPARHDDLVVVCGGVERMRPDYCVNRSTFPYYGIELVVEGKGTLMLQGEGYPLMPGVVFAYGPGVPHVIRNDPRHPMRKYYVDIAGRKVPKLLSDAGLAQGRPLRMTAAHELEDLFDDLDRESREDCQVSPELCATLVRLLLLKIRQRSMAEGRERPRSFDTYQRIRAHMQRRCLQLSTVEDVARECRVTPVYLSRLFHRFGSSGAYQYLVRQKMNLAASLLLDEGLLVKQVARRIGFRDAFQFSRAFKRVYGLSPQQFLAGHHRQNGNAEDTET